MNQDSDLSPDPLSSDADAVKLHPLLVRGIELFNCMEFFECHEVLEELWNQQSLPEKEFTQGLIQIAVGFYHLRRDNFEGANKLLARGTTRVGKFPPNYLGFDLAMFLTDVETVMKKSNRQQAVSESEFPQLAAP